MANQFGILINLILLLNLQELIIDYNELIID
jgi:hypothetical protein